MLIALLVILGVIVLAVLWAVGVYNGLIKLRNLVQEAWRQIDVELKRRHDLIGNLVETVKGYAAHERGTLEDVMKARSAAMAGGQSPGQQAQSEGMLSAALGRLIAVAEAYPSNFVAGMFNVGKADYFEGEGIERDPVKVDFGQSTYNIPPPSGYGQPQDSAQQIPNPPAPGQLPPSQG